MKIYKVTFLKNKVLTCNIAHADVELRSSHYYEHDNGQLIYALIKAEDETGARGRSEDIIKEVLEKLNTRS